MFNNQNKERMEAIQAGEKAKQSLERALRALNGARGWGIYDILGGGFFSTMFKHSKMHKASDCLEDAKRDLKNFSRELLDVNGFKNINLKTGDFWGIADWLFDGMLSDFMMQGRINDARKQVKKAIKQVDAVLDRLKAEE